MDQKELLTVVYREMLEKAIPCYMEDSYCALMDYCHAHTDTISENVSDEIFTKAEALQEYAFLAGALSVLHLIPQRTYSVTE